MKKYTSEELIEQLDKIIEDLDIDWLTRGNGSYKDAKQLEEDFNNKLNSWKWKLFDSIK